MIARFQVTGYEERQITDLQADWFSLLTFQKAFTEGIVGQATTVFVAAGDEGTRSYVATERISGRLTAEGEAGQLIVQHGGLESDPQTWFGHIVPGTGTGPFSGWAGSARIKHDDQGAYFDIEER